MKTLIQFLKMMVFAAICAFISGCGNNENTQSWADGTSGDDVIAVDSTAAGSNMDTIALPSTADSTTVLPDVKNNGSSGMIILRPAPADSLIEKSAVLGYSYIPEMERYETKNINVYISVNNPGSFIVDTLKKIIKSQAVDLSDTAVAALDTQNVSFYKYLEIELIDPDSAFKITRIHSQDKQIIDSLMDNRWRWTIRALTEDPQALLILKVIAERPNGNVERLQDINIPIRIKIVPPQNVIRKIWVFLGDNPEYFLTAILIPLAIYFGKRVFDRKVGR